MKRLIKSILSDDEYLIKQILEDNNIDLYDYEGPFHTKNYYENIHGIVIYYILGDNIFHNKNLSDYNFNIIEINTKIVFYLKIDDSVLIIYIDYHDENKKENIIDSLIDFNNLILNKKIISLNNFEHPIFNNSIEYDKMSDKMSDKVEKILDDKLEQILDDKLEQIIDDKMKM